MKSILVCCCVLLTMVAKAQVKIGNPAPEIALPNAQDSTVTLSSLKGKVVLVDFWASWCGPCRLSNPRVVQLYNKYKDAGFAVLGVSIDSKKRDWLKAVQKDKITYLQVNDRNGWKASTLNTYGVEAIPTTFLVDKNGMIAAIDEEAPALEKKIKALLAQ